MKEGDADSCCQCFRANGFGAPLDVPSGSLPGTSRRFHNSFAPALLLALKAERFPVSVRARPLAVRFPSLSKIANERSLYPSTAADVLASVPFCLRYERLYSILGDRKAFVSGHRPGPWEAKH